MKTLAFARSLHCTISLILVTATNLAAANLTVDDLRPNDLVITEYLANPVGVSDSLGEYFEIFNTTSASIDLTNLVVRDDGSNEFTIDGLNIAPMSFAVLSSSDGSALGYTPDFIYASGMTLTNGDDEIALYRPDGLLIQKAAYDDGDFFGAGIAHELTRIDPLTPNQTTGPAVGMDFVAANGVLGNGNFGSPGLRGNTRIELPVVPLPPAAILFGSALGVLAWTRRTLAGMPFRA